MKRDATTAKPPDSRADTRAHTGYRPQTDLLADIQLYTSVSIDGVPATRVGELEVFRNRP
jgi:hypothetical protein